MNASTTVSTSAQPAGLLRMSLRANAIFSTLSGLVFSLASGAIAELLGTVPPELVVGVGVQLLFFAAALIWLASRSEIPIPLAVGVIAADLLWVVGTIAVVFADLVSRNGADLAVVLASVVFVLAILQSMGVQRMKTDSATLSAKVR